MTTGLFHFTKTMWFPSYSGVLWSIGVELWFCVLFPFLLLAMHKWKPYPILGICFFVSVIIKIIGLKIAGGIINHISDNVLGDLMYFAAGMTVAYLYANNMRRSVRSALLIGGTYGIFADFISMDWSNVGYFELPARLPLYVISLLIFTVGSSVVLLELLYAKTKFCFSCLPTVRYNSSA